MSQQTQTQTCDGIEVTEIDIEIIEVKDLDAYRQPSNNNSTADQMIN